MSSTKVCLINPPTTDPNERECYFPTALLTLGGVLKKHQVGAVLWDFDLYFKKIKNTTEKKFRKLLHLGIQGTRGKIFCISSICSNFPMALWLAKEIKEFRPDSLVILGGPQPSSVPQQILEHFDFVDLVVAGEGEMTLEEMIHEDFDLEKVKSLPGIAGRRGNEIFLNPKRALVKEMDEFPLPDYSLIDFRDYINHLPGLFVPHVEVGRGCPFHCTFCSTALMWEQNYRVKSPERILKEMEFLYQHYGFKQFELIHDNFTTSRKFVYDFCEFMIKNNAHQLKWSVSSRTDCLDISRLEKMNEAGLWGLFFGIETGSKRMQQIIRKNLNLENFEPILKKGNELGLSITTAFILGFPEETKEDCNETVRKALHYKCMGTTNVYFSKLTALTGTRIYRDHLDKLELSLQASTMSPQLYGLPFVRDLIQRYPDLFSSYYHIPHLAFSKSFLTRLVEFAHYFINGIPQISEQVLESLRIQPIDLFLHWDNWCVENKIPYDNYRVYGVSHFTRDFGNFLPGFLRKISGPVQDCATARPSSIILGRLERPSATAVGS